MRSENSFYFVRRPSTRNASVARLQDQPRHEFLTMSFYLIAGAFLALGLAYLPVLAATILTALNIFPTHLT
jgi:hypothetical protein